MYPEYESFREGLAQNIISHGGISYLGLIAHAIEHAQILDPNYNPQISVHQTIPGQVSLNIGGGFSYDWMHMIVSKLKLPLTNVMRRGWVLDNTNGDAHVKADKLLRQDLFKYVYPYVADQQWSVNGNMQYMSPNLVMFETSAHAQAIPQTAFYRYLNSPELNCAIFDSPQQKSIFNFVMSTYGYVDHHVFNTIPGVTPTTYEGAKATLHYINQLFPRPLLLRNGDRTGMVLEGLDDPRPDIIYNWLKQQLVVTGIPPSELPFETQMIDIIGKEKIRNRLVLSIADSRCVYERLGGQPIQESTTRPWMGVFQDLLTRVEFLLELSDADVEVIQLFGNSPTVNLNQQGFSPKRKGLV